MASKRCSKCKQFKLKSDFYLYKNTGRLRPVCKQCVSEIGKYQRQNPTDRLFYIPCVRGNLKWCSKCKEWKKKSEFYPNKHTKYGLGAYCKKCDKQLHYHWYWHEHEKRHNRINCLETAKGHLRYCSKCKEWKPKREHHKDRRDKTGFHCWCRNCCNLQRKEEKNVIRNRMRGDALHIMGVALGQLSTDQKYDLLQIRLFRLVVSGQTSLSTARNFLDNFYSRPEEILFRVYKDKVPSNILRTV